MSQEYSAVVFEEDGWYVARCLETDIASQGNTEEEAFVNLQEALCLHLQAPRNSNLLPYCKSTQEACLLHPTGRLLYWSVSL